MNTNLDQMNDSEREKKLEELTKEFDKELTTFLNKIRIYKIQLEKLLENKQTIN